MSVTRNRTCAAAFTVLFAVTALAAEHPTDARAATLRDVRTQAWYGYGGAWGEVAETSEPTGPLGPSPSKASAPTDWDKAC